MAKNLSYFMREQKEETVKAKAPESFRDENGNPLEMEIRLLSTDKIRKINEKYRDRKIAFDKSDRPYINNGEVVFQSESDTGRALRHIIAEALVYPDLKDKELMDFYKCYDITEMPLMVFSKQSEYDYVFRTVMTALGIIEKSENDDELDTAKN
ncbi:MAG: hypothetical protein ACI4JB_03970 [Porcipelethomonas sp.]